MSDIVERLRKRATVVYLAAETTVADDLASTMTEAADEIERLRAKVALLSDGTEASQDAWIGWLFDG